MPTPYSLRIEKSFLGNFLVASAVYLASLFIIGGGPSKVVLFLTFLLTANLLLNRGLQWLGSYSSLNRAAPYLSIALDSITITLAVKFTGLEKSPLLFVYLLLFGKCLTLESLGQFIYAVVLCFSLYSGLLIRELTRKSLDPSILEGQGTLMVLATILMFLYFLSMQGKRRRREKFNSRIQTKWAVACALNEPEAGLQTKIKTVMELIQKEANTDGLKVRITLHQGEQMFLPPLGEKGAFHIPIACQAVRLGTFIISSGEDIPLVADDPEYFSSLANLLGAAIYRDRLLERAEKDIKQLQAFYLLHGEKGEPKETLLDLLHKERGN